jgi:type I restriction enzyme S subunit
MINSLIGEVCDVIAGQSPESKFYNKEANGLPFYQGKKEFTDKYIGAPTTWTTKITKEAIKDDILMSVRAPVGPVNFSTENICIGRGLAAIRAGKKIDKEYLFYFLIHHENEIVGNSGAVFNSINKRQIENLLIPLPKTIDEQKQIVVILDKAFEAIDKAKANLEKNIQNTKELFQSKLNEIFSQKGEEWEEKTLIEISKIMYGYTAKSKDSGNVKYLRITDIQDNHVEWDSVPYCDLEEDEFCKYKLEKGDIVFARTGATTGKSFLIENLPKSVFASYLIRVQLNERHLLSSFLYLFFQSSYYWNEINKGISGSAQGGFNAKKLGALKISYPSIDEQKKFVKEIDYLLEHTKQLEKYYQQKLENLEELKKSILQKAFSGELV